MKLIKTLKSDTLNPCVGEILFQAQGTDKKGKKGSATFVNSHFQLCIGVLHFMSVRLVVDL